MKTQSALLAQRLRLLVRERGLSQENFAARLGVSLPTAKRWLKGQGLSLADWLRALEVLEADPADFLREAGLATRRAFTYSMLQEEALATTPGLLAYFDLLLAGHSPAAIHKRARLTQAEGHRFLARLAKLGLILWHPGDRVVLKAQGEPRWLPQGPLAKKFRTEILGDFVGRYGQHPEHLRAGIYRLSREGQASAQGKLRELWDSLRRLEVEDRYAGRSTEVVTVLAGAAPWEPPVLRL